MLPGFENVVHHGLRSEPLARHAGLWDGPRDCRFTGTSTFCTGLVLWCVNNYVCANNTVFGNTKSTTPYPCGVCVGVTDPSDW